LPPNYVLLLVSYRQNNNIVHIRIVVGDLAGNMVEDMSLRDTIGSMCANPAHNTAKVTEKVTVERSKGTTREGELGGTVMRKERIGVLKEGNQDEPVVYPKVRLRLGCLCDSGSQERTRGKGHHKQ
jgi:hypothetical protein